MRRWGNIGVWCYDEKREGALAGVASSGVLETRGRTHAASGCCGMRRVARVNTLLKLRNARKVVRLLGNTRPGMNVLVLYDLYTEGNLQPLAVAINECEAHLHLLQIEGSTRHGGQFSSVVAQAMRAADLVIAMTQANAAHTEARRNATQSGVGVIVLPESSSPDFFLAQGWEADFEQLRHEIQGLADALTSAETARVTSAGGTDITMSIAGRRGRALHGFANVEDISAG